MENYMVSVDMIIEMEKKTWDILYTFTTLIEFSNFDYIVHG